MSSTSTRSESSSGLPGPSGVGSPLHSMLHFFPQGHEKPLKQAFYNTAANLFILFAIGAAVAVYFVLEAFLRPLLWAVLCGTFLYPFKYQITNFVQGWLQSLSDSDTPLAVGVAILPLTAVNYSANLLGGLASRKWKLILGVAFGMPAVYFVYYFGPLEKMLHAVQGSIHAVYHMLGYFSAVWVWTTVIAYLVAVVFWWKPGTSTALKVLSIPVWAVLLLHLATVAGPFRVPLFVAVVTIMVVGFVAELRAGGTADILAKIDLVLPASRSQVHPSSTYNQGNLVSTTMFDQSDGEGSPQKQPPPAENIRPSSFPDTPKRQSKSSLESTLARKKSKQMPFSNKCILWLVYAIVVVRLWMHLWILELLPIPLSVLLIKKLAVQVSMWEVFQTKLQHHKQTAKEWLSARQEALAPRPIRGLWKLFLQGDKKISYMLEKSLNALTSTFVILLLLVGTTLLTILLAIQVHQESVHLVNVTSNVLNETLHPDINEWLSDSGGIQTTMDSMMDNAYVYGREWIAAKINDSLSGQPVDKKLIKKQVLEIWDRLYHTWLAKNTTVVSSKLSKHGNMTSNMMSVWHGVSHLGLSEVTSFVQENMSTLMSVLESIWAVLKGNINLALSMVTATISIVFFSGTAILNFVLSTVIFLTTLFYLLSVSENQYKPVEWIVNLFPSPGQGGSTNRLGQTVEEAIRSVFGASLKMAVFYGLYTWLTHTVFGINIVFIPSALAAVFAAVPFVGTYWAALPAVLDLWLVQDKSVLAILLAVCHLIPMSFVDTAIYSEIKGGGHPYLTGLAVAGGIYIAGLEGALIGPILLCCLLVAMNVYSGMIQGSGMTPTSEHSMRTHRGIPMPLKRAFSEADQH
ncbi:transmembrane protein 245-like isoform X1 [Branchiostoma lanceolatum]|uniref:transmembrane protein 245-like isoform X1 n=1 Tax=Branchiostoma lanceolatum TaxID=7740 RepID=UPI0034518CE7